MWRKETSGRARRSRARGTANRRGRNTLSGTSPKRVARAMRRDLRRLARGSGGLANSRTRPAITRYVRGNLRVRARGSGSLGCTSRRTGRDVTRSVRRDLVRSTGGGRICWVTMGDVARRMGRDLGGLARRGGRNACYWTGRGIAQRMGRDLRARISGRDVRRVAMGKVAAWVRWALRGFASGSRGLSSSRTVRDVARAVRVSLRRRA